MSTLQVLYRFWDADEQLLYVGITLNPGHRWTSHRNDKPWWSEVATITIETHPDRRAVLEAERRAIVAERPRYNIVHNYGRPIVVRRVDHRDTAIERAAAGERVIAYLSAARRTSRGTLVGVVGQCPFCGSTHTHGLGADIDNPDLGWRSSHCMNGPYYLISTLAASTDPSLVAAVPA